MGVSKTPAQMAGKLENLAKEMGNVNPTLNAVGLRGKEIFIAAEGRPLSIKSNGRRRPIGTRYDLKGHTVVIRYTGPAHLLNDPTKAHVELPRRRPGARGRRKGARALRFPDGGFAASAPHPGTKGMHFFQKAKVVAEHELPKLFARKTMTEPLKRTFG